MTESNSEDILYCIYFDLKLKLKGWIPQMDLKRPSCVVFSNRLDTSKKTMINFHKPWEFIQFWGVTPP